MIPQREWNEDEERLILLLCAVTFFGALLCALWALVTG